MLKDFEIMEYRPLVDEVKELIHKKQYKVLKVINAETINLYWEIGEEIYKQQEENGWGKVKISDAEIDTKKLAIDFLRYSLLFVIENQDYLDVGKFEEALDDAMQNCK